MWGNDDTSMDVSEEPLVEKSSFSGNDGGRRGHNIVPLMIGHILNAEDKLEIFNIKIHTVSVVGIVIEIEEQTTKITYKVQDDTGVIPAVYWIETGGSQAPPSIKIKTYVRVRGIPRNDQEGQKHILILHIVPLKSYNEFVCHMLEVIDTTLKARKLTEEINKQTMPQQESSSNNEGSEMNKEDASDDISGLSKEQMSIFKLIQAENESESGIDRNTLKARVPKDVVPRIDTILNFLMSKDHIYTTLSEDHFKTT